MKYLFFCLTVAMISTPAGKVKNSADTSGITIPAQALSYKTGAMKIRELRGKYQQQLGNKFNLAAFHDELPKDGVKPLDVMESKMDERAKNNN